MPSLEINIRKDKLSPQELDFYTSMYQQSLTQFDTYVDKGTVLHNFAHVFDLIMRLRQAVDHPYLIIHSSLRSADGAAKSAIPTRSRGDTDVCALCQEDVEDDRVQAHCGHCFHRDCVQEYMQEAPELPNGGIGCPTCYSPLTVNLEEPADGEDEPLVSPYVALEGVDKKQTKRGSIMQRIKTSEFQSSTKIEALLQEIREMNKDPASKGLVFSQFVNFLELIEWRLKKEGVTCAKLLGSMSWPHVTTSSSLSRPTLH